MNIFQNKNKTITKTNGYTTTTTRDRPGGKVINRTVVYNNGPWKKTFVNGQCTSIYYNGKKVK